MLGSSPRGSSRSVLPLARLDAAHCTLASSRAGRGAPKTAGTSAFCPADSPTGSDHDYIDAQEYGSPNRGIDEVSGGGGNDTINVWDGVRVFISCGGGIDTVYFDVGIDEVAANCENQNPPRQG